MRVGVFHTAFIGDVVLLGLLIEALRESGHQIVLFTNPAGIQVYRNDARISALVEIKKPKGLKKLTQLRSLSKVIAEARLDALLVAHRSHYTALVVANAGLRRTVGFKDAGFAFLYSETVAFDKTLPESVRLLSLATGDLVGAEARRRWAERPFGFLLPKGERARPRKFQESFPELFLADGKTKNFFVVAPGSVWKTKQYPPAELARVVISLLERNSDLVCVVSGGPSDASAIRDFYQGMEAQGGGELGSRVLDASRGALPLSEMASVFALAKFVLSNDSAPLHFASGTNTPVAGIFGPTSATTGLGPTSERRRVIDYATQHGVALDCQPCSRHGHDVCPRGHHHCLVKLSPATVAHVVEEMLPELFSQPK